MPDIKDFGDFLPGYGVFETLRVEEGTAFFVEEHWKSLQQSAKMLGLCPRQDFRKCVSRLPKKATGKWRWIVSRAEEKDFFDSRAKEPQEVFSLAVAETRVGSRNWDSRLKTLSYLVHYQARLSVEADEAVILNEHGEVVSGAMSNLFWVKDAKIYTPSVETGCRKGIIRGWVMSEMEVIETRMGPEILQEADEIFLTNSWIGIRPVVRFQNRILERGKIAMELSKKLKATYSLFKSASSLDGISSQIFNQGAEELSEGAR
ncbi:aminotransferase class IV [Candidatus Methylacidiphilum infernorum]|uniref:branched-chain-amino-acid transaminase n=1 Tax=Candidatus Methylacidiphilum infernorum TaxID=511746 RepID=A0ABX7PV36_9BACT|nr:aminotransferase class IV [Candidatus Methylacidiphilum infernorum]QSR86543.1 aminotransferase class IV [Candidatus Methylacidiphilum infernorum]